MRRINLPDSRDARQRQEESEVIGEVLEGTDDGVAACQVFRLEVRAVGREDELRLGLGGGWAVLERLERLRDLPGSAGQDVDVVGLEDAAEVGLVRRPGAKALDRRLLVAKGFKEDVGELCGVEGLLRKVGDGLFNFYCVHVASCLREFFLLASDRGSLAGTALRGATL